MSPSVAVPRPRRFDRRALTLLTLLLPTLVLSLLGWQGGVAVAADEPVEIAEAPALTWGFKQSWRIYAPEPTVAGGAAVVPDAGAAPYQLAWTFAVGQLRRRDRHDGPALRRAASTGSSTRPRSRASRLRRATAGPMDIHVLDVTLSDPIVTISGDGPRSRSRRAAASSTRGSWSTSGRVDVVGLDVGDVTPAVAGGVTSWTGIPAATAGSSNEVFAGNYPTGRAVDAVGFSYSGPGGAPDFSEDFDAPGSAKLELAGQPDRHHRRQRGAVRAMVDRPRPPHRPLPHPVDVGGANEWTYRAFSLDTLQEVGEPLVLPDAERVASETLFDSTSGRLFYARASDAETQRWIRFDADQGQYELGTLDAPIPVAGPPSLMWDAVGQRAFNIDLTIPDGVSEDDVDAWEWKLYTYAEQQDGSWTRKTYDLPSFPPGLNLFGYAFNTFLNTPMGAGAADGSLILLGDIQVSLDPEVPDPATVPGAYRIVFDEDGDSVSVSPIEGTEVPNGGAHLFTTLQRGPGGELVLMRPESATAPTVQTLSVAADGSGAQASPPVSVPGLDTTDGNAFAVDRQDGTIWLGGWQSQRIVGIRDGEVIADQFFAERHPARRPVIAGADHAVYAQTNDGSPPVFGGSPIYGFGRFDVLGPSPTVTQQPQPARSSWAWASSPRAVSLAPRPRRAAPQPSRRWQVKLPGASRFADLDGETGRDARGRGHARPRRRAVPGAVRERGGADRHRNRRRSRSPTHRASPSTCEHVGDRGRRTPSSGDARGRSRPGRDLAAPGRRLLAEHRRGRRRLHDRGRDADGEGHQRRPERRAVPRQGLERRRDRLLEDRQADGQPRHRRSRPRG